MRLIYIHRADFDKRPPVISAIYILLSLGIKPILITSGISDFYKNDLKEKGVDIHIVPFSREKSKFQKIGEFWRYRKTVYKILKNYSPEKYTLWLEGNYTFVTLGRKVKKYRLILQMQELYINYLNKIATGALLKKSELNFMPEYNRSVFYQIKFKLADKPLVLPNKPYFFPTEQQLDEFSLKHNVITTQLKDKKVILYQGLLTKERDLTPFIKAIKELGEEYVVVLLGRDYGVLKSYFKVNPEIIHINYLPAPEYLYFTRLAHIGIVTYDPYRFNSAYCAPNKIFEYSACGVPMIGNDIPGLRYPMDSYKMGVIVNEKSAREIHQAIKNIEDNYMEFSQNARCFFDSVDNTETIKLGLSRLKNPLKELNPLV